MSYKSPTSYLNTLLRCKLILPSRMNKQSSRHMLWKCSPYQPTVVLQKLHMTNQWCFKVVLNLKSILIYHIETSYQPMIFLFTVILWIACLILGVCINQRCYNFRISIKWCVFALDFSQWKGELFTFWRVCVHMTACKRTHAFPALLNVCILSTQHKDFSILVYIRQLYRLQLKFTLI